MKTSAVGQSGVALIGLYALVMGLSDLPREIGAALLMQKLYAGTAKLSDLLPFEPAFVTISRGGAFLICLGQILPGATVILARRRIAGWLLPPAESTGASLAASHLLRIGLVLIGIHMIAGATTSAFTVVATPSVAPTTEEHRWIRLLLGPAFYAAAGVIILLASRWLSVRFTRPPEGGA